MKPINTTMGGIEWTMLILISICWGSSFFFNRVAVGEFPVLSIVLGRIGIGAILKGILCTAVLLLGLRTSLSVMTGTMLALRTLAGILSPLILSLMTWQILKYKNTQAATGVLFVGVILTFIGELVAAILQQELHLPL